jgi:mono/diheme cytochrome c family protein
VRGTDAEILKSGRDYFTSHCGSCHQPSALQPVHQRGTFANGTRVEDAVVLALIREGHNGAAGVTFDDRTLFSLLAYLKAPML